ncbi:MAG: cyclic nucleotide-binding domain-containing protein [Deltaproteobacteria bacterium]|nr:cyclic nucleotide-binding domain-containing protein [Deltaproteobacteria bacterium]
MKNYSLFTGIKDDHQKMSTIVSIMEPRKFKKGQYILKEMDKGDELFILTAGAVRVLKNTKQKEEYTIVDLNANQYVFFGEIALMDSDERSASIKSLEDCDVLVIKRDQFIDLGNRHPDICLPITRVIAKIISERLRNVNNDVILLFDALVNEIKNTQL